MIISDNYILATAQCLTLILTKKVYVTGIIDLSAAAVSHGANIAVRKLAHPKQTVNPQKNDHIHRS